MHPRLAASLAGALLAGTSAAAAEPVFNRVATFPVHRNLPDGSDPTAGALAEIITASEDGETLVYTDAPGGVIGFVDISDPAAPARGGIVPVDGEPTAVAVIGETVFAGVNTSESFAEPTGVLAVIPLGGETVAETCVLAGQPDSIAASPDGRFLAVVIENERDEELNDGAIPQLPTGLLQVFDLEAGAISNCDAPRAIDLTGLSEIAPEDAEPEFVDVNEAGEAVVSLQENNHIAIVDLATGEVTGHFSAGAVPLEAIDTEEDGIVAPTGSAPDVAREPDAIHWIDGTRFVTANEGDYEGGSRNFTIFDRSGEVSFDVGSGFEHLAMSIGHYPENRSDAKGTEPEGIEVASFGDQTLIFVGSERGSFVAVYRDTGGEPEFVQALPAGQGPEGLLAIPSRDLLVVSSEEDDPESGLRASIMLYARAEGESSYPTIQSDLTDSQAPIAWGALSGLAADAENAGRLYAVTDSIYSSARILEIDATAMPARIVGETTVTKDGAAVEGYDLEGIATRDGGGFWLASEGDPEAGRGNMLVRVAADGTVEEEIALPEALAGAAKPHGLEGVAVTGEDDTETVWLAVQRAWQGDPADHAKLIAYKPADGSWAALLYPLESAEAGWVGLSEITATEDGRLLIVERDNQIGERALVKRLYAVSLDGVEAAPLDGELPTVEKTLAYDFLDDLRSASGYVLDKVEGFAVASDGNAYMVTDNDGVDGSNGETQFFALGAIDTPN